MSTTPSFPINPFHLFQPSDSCFPCLPPTLPTLPTGRRQAGVFGLLAPDFFNPQRRGYQNVKLQTHTIVQSLQVS